MIKKKIIFKFLDEVLSTKTIKNENIKKILGEISFTKKILNPNSNLKLKLNEKNLLNTKQSPDSNSIISTLSGWNSPVLHPVINKNLLNDQKNEISNSNPEENIFFKNDSSLNLISTIKFFDDKKIIV